MVNVVLMVAGEISMTEESTDVEEKYNVNPHGGSPVSWMSDEWWYRLKDAVGILILAAMAAAILWVIL